MRYLGHTRSYLAVAEATLLRAMTYRLQFWVTFLGQCLTVTLFVGFWQAVYQGRTSLAGLDARQTISYIILAQLLLPLNGWTVVSGLGWIIRDGSIATELARPLDLQLRFYVEGLASVALILVQQALPIGLLAAIFYGFRLTLDPFVWAAFAVSLLLGISISFLFDWLVGCLAFFTTEVWGLMILRNGITTFFSGALIPLVMLPAGLRSVAYALPFGQTVYQPLSLLAGITPVQSAPRLILVQLLWLMGLGVVARLAFQAAVRHVTVQGG